MPTTAGVLPPDARLIAELSGAAVFFGDLAAVIAKTAIFSLST
ncbi:MAG: hypothetical protein ABSH32_24085 [Bryobacteraceae bacterium]|jgi:hypothetical protein